MWPSVCKFARPLQAACDETSRDIDMSDNQPPATDTLPRARLALLFTASLVIAAGNTAQQSVMPAIGSALGIADVWISIAYTWSAVLWMTCAPIWARRSDRRGRKAMMRIGLFGFIASFVFGGFPIWAGLNGHLAPMAAILLFAAARSFYGGFGSAAPPAFQAYVASRTRPEERTRALSLMASSFGLGTVIGPALASVMLVPGLGLSSSFLIYALIGCVMLALLHARLPDDRPAFAARGAVASDPGHSGGEEPALPDPSDEPVRLAWRDPRLRAWLTAGVLAVNAQAMVSGFAGFLVLDRLALRATPEAGAGPVGLVMMCGALATLLAQWGLIPMLRLAPRQSCVIGMAVATAGTALLCFAHGLNPIALGFSVFSFGIGLFRPGYTAGSSLAVERAEQGQVAGIVTSVNGSAFIVAPALGVWLYGMHDLVGFGLVGALCLAALAATLRTQGNEMA